MTYYKIIDLGHVIQVYEMEKAPFMGDSKFIKHDDGYNALDFPISIEETKERNWLNGWERYAEKLTKEERKKERRSQTLRDAKNTLKRLALANFKTDDLFVTLTYAENMDDVERGDKDLKAWVRKMRKKYNQDFQYIAVREFQKRGALHYHLMINLKIEIKDNEHNKLLEREFASHWKNGFVDIMRMDKHRSKRTEFKDKPIDNVGAYLSKYFSKSADDERLEGKKIYLPSRGLIRPIVYSGEDAEEFLKKINLDKEKRTFTNEYPTDYLGKITFAEYNFLR